MLFMSLLLCVLPVSEAGKKDPKAKRLARQAQIEARVLDAPMWNAASDDEDRIALEGHLDACTEGQQDGCTELGIAYARGELVVQNFDRSVVLLRKACESGALKGCTHLG